MVKPNRRREMAFDLLPSLS